MSSSCLAVVLDRDEHPAIAASRTELALYDRHRDSREQHLRARHLASVGTSDAEAAAILGVCDRTVHRIRHRETPAPHRPPLPDPTTVSDARATELEDTAQLALNLACLLREEDPNLVWGALSRLTRPQLQELTVIALAAVPIDGWSASELFAWVHNLPAAQAEQPDTGKVSVAK